MPAPTNPVVGGATEGRILSNTKFGLSQVVANDQNLKPGTLLALVAGKLASATTGDRIEWVCTGYLDVDTNSLNKEVSYRRAQEEDLYIFDVTTADITQAKVGKYFEFDAEHKVVGNTDVAVFELDAPLQLVEVIGVRKWLFRITREWATWPQWPQWA